MDIDMERVRLRTARRAYVNAACDFSVPAAEVERLRAEYLSARDAYEAAWKR